MSIFNSLGTNYSPSMVLKSLRPASSKDINNLKKLLVKKYQAEQVVLTNRGREALVVILKSLNLKQGDYVAITGFTCYVVYEAVVAAGLLPILIDIEKDNLNFTGNSLEIAFKKQPNIKAVIIQNTLGIPINIVEIEKICKDNNLYLVEDLAHSAGAIYEDGREAGTVGIAAALSFGQNKMIDSAAGGAAIFKRSQKVNLQLKNVNVWNKLTNNLYPLTTYLIRLTHRFFIGKLLLSFSKITHILPDPLAGYSGDIRKLPAHQAKLAATYIENLSVNIVHRQKIASIYREILPKHVLLNETKGSTNIRFPIIVNNKISLEKSLSKAGIHTGTSWYDSVISPKRFMKLSKLYIPGSCPNGERMVEHIINLPTHVNINEEKARLIAGKVNEWLNTQ